MNWIDGITCSVLRVDTGGRSFTTISAYWQFHRATELFGPCGVGWGWTPPVWSIEFEANLPQHSAEAEPHQSRTDAATMLNVSPRSVQTAKKVQQAAPELAEKVKAGEGEE